MSRTLRSSRRHPTNEPRERVSPWALDRVSARLSQRSAIDRNAQRITTSNTAATTRPAHAMSGHGRFASRSIRKPTA